MTSCSLNEERNEIPSSCPEGLEPCADRTTGDPPCCQTETPKTTDTNDATDGATDPCPAGWVYVALDPESLVPAACIREVLPIPGCREGFYWSKDVRECLSVEEQAPKYESEWTRTLCEPQYFCSAEYEEEGDSCVATVAYPKQQVVKEVRVTNCPLLPLCLPGFSFDPEGVVCTRLLQDSGQVRVHRKTVEETCPWEYLCPEGFQALSPRVAAALPPVDPQRGQGRDRESWFFDLPDVGESEFDTEDDRGAPDECVFVESIPRATQKDDAEAVVPCDEAPRCPPGFLPRPSRDPEDRRTFEEVTQIEREGICGALRLASTERTEVLQRTECPFEFFCPEGYSVPPGVDPADLSFCVRGELLPLQSLSEEFVEGEEQQEECEIETKCPEETPTLCSAGCCGQLQLLPPLSGCVKAAQCSAITQENHPESVNTTDTRNETDQTELQFADCVRTDGSRVSPSSSKAEGCVQKCPEGFGSCSVLEEAAGIGVEGASMAGFCCRISIGTPIFYCPRECVRGRKKKKNEQRGHPPETDESLASTLPRLAYSQDSSFDLGRAPLGVGNFIQKWNKNWARIKPGDHDPYAAGTPPEPHFSCVRPVPKRKHGEEGGEENRTVLCPPGTEQVPPGFDLSFLGDIVVVHDLEGCVREYRRGNEREWSLPDFLFSGTLSWCLLTKQTEALQRCPPGCSRTIGRSPEEQAGEEAGGSTQPEEEGEPSQPVSEDPPPERRLRGLDDAHPEQTYSRLAETCEASVVSVSEGCPFGYEECEESKHGWAFGWKNETDGQTCCQLLTFEAPRECPLPCHSSEEWKATLKAEGIPDPNPQVTFKPSPLTDLIQVFLEKLEHKHVKCFRIVSRDDNFCPNSFVRCPTLPTMCCRVTRTPMLQLCPGRCTRRPPHLHEINHHGLPPPPCYREMEQDFFSCPEGWILTLRNESSEGLSPAHVCVRNETALPSLQCPPGCNAKGHIPLSSRTNPLLPFLPFFASSLADDTVTAGHHGCEMREQVTYRECPAQYADVGTACLQRSVVPRFWRCPQGCVEEQVQTNKLQNIFPDWHQWDRNFPPPQTDDWSQEAHPGHCFKYEERRIPTCDSPFEYFPERKTCLRMRRSSPEGLECPLASSAVPDDTKKSSGDGWPFRCVVFAEPSAMAGKTREPRPSQKDPDEATGLGEVREQSLQTSSDAG
uniref:Uncharacterized protein n=1 Tax=Chromera velia CCMP2878 TaxID=1169474 RepID=A0A0G4F6H7_9ALVE|eukprot:Cvel_15445.t1-p1 / transcript=Cvel_15445.t1 / gene=Cvel_15445 / organism=Chromera_velia_CCMP2878 / gene_product=hypothetical protein / transcript_product=hypothetical protein / location=Cvel_scaffold1143:15206-27334(+) / protein_length=1178 / sequence_SO=supercontig / SO=protein_coding / is_pseudo=false